MIDLRSKALTRFSGLQVLFTSCKIEKEARLFFFLRFFLRQIKEVDGTEEIFHQS